MTQHEAVGLWERILSRENLFQALERVQASKGAPGVDGMTVAELPEHLRTHWLFLSIEKWFSHVLGESGK